MRVSLWTEGIRRLHVHLFPAHLFNFMRRASSMQQEHAAKGPRKPQGRHCNLVCGRCRESIVYLEFVSLAVFRVRQLPISRST